MNSKMTWSPISKTGFAKSIKLRLHYTNHFAWRMELVRVLRIANCAHYISRDDCNAIKLEELLYEWPVARVEMRLESDKNTSVLVTTATTAQQDKYNVDMVA